LERGLGGEVLLTPQQISLWHQLLAAARHIIITCHRGPDGDAIGSTTALASWLRRHYPEADIHIVAPNIFPDFLKWIPGANEILIYEGHEEEVRPVVEAADLVIMCDHGELKRMATLGDVVRDHPTPRIMIDHHLNPEPDIADLVISHPELSSTCEVLLRVMLWRSSGVDSKAKPLSQVILLCCTTAAPKVNPGRSETTVGSSSWAWHTPKANTRPNSSDSFLIKVIFLCFQATKIVNICVVTEIFVFLSF
jgi:hypothetical protein